MRFRTPPGPACPGRAYRTTGLAQAVEERQRATRRAGRCRRVPEFFGLRERGLKHISAILVSFGKSGRTRSSVTNGAPVFLASGHRSSLALPAIDDDDAGLAAIEEPGAFRVLRSEPDVDCD